MEYIRQVLIGVENVFEVKHNRSAAHVYQACHFMKASSFNHILSTTYINIPKQLFLTL